MKGERPRILDLFCGAGGAAVGYARAGFEVVGVDIEPQPHYPFEFYQLEAIELLRDLGCMEATPEWRYISDFDAFHVSPPCQAFTAYRRGGNVGEYPDLIEDTRDLLRLEGKPYVIENVEGAPLENPIRVCGTGFGMDIQRHRLFESNFPLMGVPCSHGQNAPDRFPGGRSKGRTGSSRGLVRATIEVGSWDIPLSVQQEAMGIDWMTLEELSEAIPPSYTEHVGSYLLAYLEAERKAAV